MEEEVLRGCNTQLSVLAASHSPPVPWVRRPGTPLRPVVGVAAVAAGACLGPCAALRQRGVGTHARGPGLLARVVVRPRLSKKGSRAAGAESGWESLGKSNP